MKFNNKYTQSEKEEGREKLIETAWLVLNKKLNIIQGARDMLGFALQAGVYGDDIFLSIIGLESETDNLLVGENDSLSPEQTIKKLGTKDREYVRKTEKVFLQTVKEIISKYS